MDKWRRSKFLVKEFLDGVPTNEPEPETRNQTGVGYQSLNYSFIHGMENASFSPAIRKKYNPGSNSSVL